MKWIVCVIVCAAIASLHHEIVQDHNQMKKRILLHLKLNHHVKCNYSSQKWFTATPWNNRIHIFMHFLLSALKEPPSREQQFKMGNWVVQLLGTISTAIFAIKKWFTTCSASFRVFSLCMKYKTLYTSDIKTSQCW